MSRKKEEPHRSPADAEYSRIPESAAETSKEKHEILFIARYEDFIKKFQDYPFVERRMGAQEPLGPHTPKGYLSPEDIKGKTALFENAHFSVFEMESAAIIERDNDYIKMFRDLYEAINKIPTSNGTSSWSNQPQIRKKPISQDENNEKEIYSKLKHSVGRLLNNEKNGVERDTFLEAIGLIEKVIELRETDLNKPNNRKKEVSERCLTQARSLLSSIKNYPLPDGRTEPTALAVIDRRIWNHRESKEVKPSHSIELTFDYSLMTEVSRNKLPEALRDLNNLSFRKGEITTLVGPNGCGKSTFARALQTAIEYYQFRPDSSQTTILQSIEDESGATIPQFVAELARCMDVQGLQADEGCIFLDMARGAQNFVTKHRDRGLETGDFISGMLAAKKVTSKSTGQVQEDMIEDAKKHYKLDTYAGVLIVDEPEKGLDPWKLREMKGRLRALAPKATILVVTHNPIMVFDGEIPRLDFRYIQKGVHVNKEEAIFNIKKD